MKKATVLVVDDEPFNLKLVAECLAESYQIKIALSGEEALSILRKRDVDLILLDIGMPGMDGFEVCRQAKNNPSSQDIPIVFLTGDNLASTVVRAFKSGAVDYVIKPFHSDELKATVETHIRFERLERENRRLTHIIDTYVAFVKVDTEGIIRDASEQFCATFKIEREKLLGSNINVLKSGLTPKSHYDMLWNTVNSGEVFRHDIVDRNFSGGLNWYNVTISPEIMPDNTIMGYVAFYQNIDKEMQYKYDAQTDQLTALMNRKKIDEVIINEILRTQRSSHPLSILLIDIDKFKDVNDTYGHMVGDSVLKEFSSLISKNVRLIDSVGRWGGEEFLIVCPYTDASGAAIVAETIRSAIEGNTFEKAGNLTASIGIAQYENGENAERLFEAADNALYTAKERGRNRIVIAPCQTGSDKTDTNRPD